MSAAAAGLLATSTASAAPASCSPIGMIVRSGATVCQGDSLTTGPRSPVQLRLRDGAGLRLGASTTITNLRLAWHSDRFGLSSGSVWGAAARGGLRNRFAVELGMNAAGGAVGVSGSAFTASRRSAVDPVVLHAIEGRGFARLSGDQRIHFLAGYTAIASSNSVRLSMRWPAPQRSLVPPAQRPPSITRLRLVTPGRGAAGRLALGLDRPARVVVRVFFANHRVAMLVTHARGGLNVLRPIPHRLAPGVYVVTVQASRGGRVTLVRRVVSIGRRHGG